ncbi:MAG: NUDIX domain-containing protein [Cyanobacteria bacterium P01_A01_bin.83]
MGTQDKFFEKIAEYKLVRVSVRSICLQESHVLVEQPADNPHACYSFIGGELEFGELMESALKREYQEEIGLETRILRYLFVVENRFQFNDKLIHSLEHYFQTEIEQTKITSQESDLIQHWLPIKHIKDYDLRPHIVRDALDDGSWQTAKRLIVS